MAERKIADWTPVVTELEPGECRCKHTKEMPFCDGTHSELKKP